MEVQNKRKPFAKKSLFTAILIAVLLIQENSLLFFSSNITYAAPIQDNTNGTWTDTFSDATGLTTSATTEVVSGSIKLTQGITSLYSSFDSSLAPDSALGSTTVANDGVAAAINASGYTNPLYQYKRDKP